MARAAGVRVGKVLAYIEPTQGLEDDLYNIIIPIVRAYVRQLGYIETAWVSPEAMTRALVESIINTSVAPAQALVAAVEPQVEGWADRVERWHRKRWAGTIKSATGGRLDIEPILSQGTVRAEVVARTQQNVALIKGLSADIEKKLVTQVWESYAGGDTGPALAKKLRAEFGFAPARAKLIARDQLAKYADALDEARALEGGLVYYVWKTVGDGVVRPTHRARNGKRYRNDTPPAGTGHPGHEVNCRCKRAQVLLTDDEEAQLAALGLGGLT